MTEPDPVEPPADLRTPGWTRLLAAARRKLERSGVELDGSVGLTDPSDVERRVVIAVTGHYRQATTRRITVSLRDLDAAIHDEHGIGLLAALARLDGPVRNRPGERADEEAARAAVTADATRRGGPLVREAWFTDWLAGLQSDGTLTRLVHRGDGHLLGWAVEVLRRLPADDLPLPVLAEWATGDTKALSTGALAGIVLAALAARDGVPMPRTTGERRALWSGNGVVVDDLASQVLVLNVRVREETVVAGWLGDAADFGIPFRLTLHQMTSDPLTPAVPEIYVCENPAVLRTAAAELADRSAALVCTEGQPSAACHRLLAAAISRGTRLHWRGDFDWTGLRSLSSAISRYAAQPWRMSADDYAHALERGESEPLRGGAAASPWDPELAARMASAGRAVMEERIIVLLLDDLRR